ncbi:MAG: SLC13 family permease [Prevotella sp.]
MTLIIVSILLVGLFLIATENLTNINKTAVAIFIGTLGWMLYISNGSDFVMSQHSDEYLSFLGDNASSGNMVKQFIAQNIFLKYVGRASEIVLFLLATMTIVEILQSNGCFDFISQLLRTRNSRKMLWILSVVTFVISANLDNITTTVMMLIMMHNVVKSRRQRMLLGCAIVLSANCGGALTVIGDPTGLVLWNNGAVTATNFSLTLALPCLVAWALPVWWIGRALPERLDTEWITMPYRGDDTNLNIWQRLLMLFVGIGGLWFIPTFHNITKLSPFIGALCVLSVLWIVHEIMNRKLLNTSDTVQRRIPRVLQYGVIQMILYVMGVILAVSVARETGVMQHLTTFIDNEINNVWIVGAISGTISVVLENFATAVNMISISDMETIAQSGNIEGLSVYGQNGMYWKIIAYTSAVAGNILCIGSVSGVALMKMERLHVGWYFRNAGLMALVGAVAGYALLWFLMEICI